MKCSSKVLQYERDVVHKTIFSGGPISDFLNVYRAGQNMCSSKVVAKNFLEINTSKATEQYFQSDLHYKIGLHT